MQKLAIWLATAACLAAPDLASAATSVQEAKQACRALYKGQMGYQQAQRMGMSVSELIAKCVKKKTAK